MVFHTSELFFVKHRSPLVGQLTGIGYSIEYVAEQYSGSGRKGLFCFVPLELPIGLHALIIKSQNNAAAELLTRNKGVMLIGGLFQLYGSSVAHIRSIPFRILRRYKIVEPGLCKRSRAFGTAVF